MSPDMMALLSGLGTLVFVVVMVLFSVLITVLSMALPLGIMYFMFKTMSANAAAERKLIETGIPAAATITAVGQTGMYINNNPQVQIVLEVVPEDGEPYTVSVNKVLQLVQIPQVQPGKVVDVRIDPENPKRLAIVGL